MRPEKISEYRSNNLIIKPFMKPGTYIHKFTDEMVSLPSELALKKVG